MKTAFNLELFNKLPLVGILRFFKRAEVEKLVPASLEGGLCNLEITMNSEGAEDLIRLTCSLAGKTANVGAGTVTSLASLERALQAGASFIVTPAVLPDVIRAYREAIATLRELGARVEEASFPLDFDEMMVQNGRIIAAEAYALHRAYIEDPSLDIDPWVRKRVLSGKAIGADEYTELLSTRQRVIAQFAEWMRDRDALLTPTLPITATPLPEVDEATTPLATWTRSANYLGACALSLPAGFSAEGLPIGVQVTGAAFADAMLIRIGRAFQRSTDWHLRRPY